MKSMKIMHRYDSDERQHYIINQNYSVKLHPKLLYVGELEKKAGWSDDLHSHDFIELIFVLEGKGSVRTEKEVLPIQKGDIIVYNADFKHAETSSADEPISTIFIAINDISTEGLPKNHLLSANSSIRFPSGEHYEFFNSIMSNMLLEASNKATYYHEIAYCGLKSLLLMIFRILENKENFPKTDSNSTFINLKNYIDNNFLTDITLETIAENCFANKFYLSHLFSGKQGTTIQDYILSRRIEYSKKLLLETNLNICEVSEKSGFSSSSYFCRVFKKLSSFTPFKYKKTFLQ